MFQWVALLIGVATIMGSGLYWIRSYLKSRVAEEHATAALRDSEKRVDAMERAAAAERDARDREFDAEKSAVRDAAGAADLLRRQFPGPH